MPRPFSTESARYPLSESSTLELTDGLLFPETFLQDAHVYATRSGLYGITAVSKRQTTLDITIGTPGARELIFGRYDLVSDLDQIGLVDAYGRRAGVLLLSDRDAFRLVPDGDYSLRDGSAIFEAACHVPASAGCVSGLVIEAQADDGAVRTPMSGVVRLTGTQGVTLECRNDELFIHFTGEPYGNVWQDSAGGHAAHGKWVSSVSLTVENSQDPAYSTTELLFPDNNGHIPIYMNNLLPLESDALRLFGEQDRLTIGLAR